MSSSDQTRDIHLAVTSAQSAAREAQTYASTARVIALQLGQLPANSLFFQGTWDTSVYYAGNAVVEFSGALYMSLVANNKGHEPDTSPSQWQVFAEAGGGGTVHTGSGIQGDGTSGTPVALADQGVTNVKISATQGHVKGRKSSGTGPAEDLDGTDVAAMIAIDGTTIARSGGGALKVRQSAAGTLVGNPTNSIADIIDVVPLSGSMNSGNVVAGFVPPGLVAAGLALDFDADTIAGSDGSAIPNWVDSSGNNVVASVAAGTPLLKTADNGINGHNVVRFTSGTAALQCYLSLPLQVRDWVGMTVYYVARSGSTSPYSRYGGVFGWQATGQFLNIALGSATDGQGAGWTNVGDKGFGNVDGWTTATPFWGSYRYDKHNWTIEGVRSPTGTVADTSWPTDSHTVAWIGSNYYLGSQSDNDIARLIVYNRLLTDAEDAQVIAYLKYRYGFVGTAPANIYRVGYPDTLVNQFAIRYVHPAGSDTDPAHDGKTWQTAYQTILAALDAAVAELGVSAMVELRVHDGCYVGGEVPSQGLWFTNASLDPGWRHYTPLRIIGYGGVVPGRGFTDCKARIYQGRPGDDQSFDLSKPLIWDEDSENPFIVENIQPATYGFARLGVKRTGTRDGNLENLTWRNVLMASPPDTSPVFGPAFDCGWISESQFYTCQAVGSAIYRDVTLDPADHATAAGQTITLANGGFDSTYVGGYLIIIGGPNEAQWFIASVSSATTVVISNPNGQMLVDETFTTETVQKIQGPQVIDDDNHAGWLFRPTDVSGGEPGTMGAVWLDRPSFQQCGIKYYLGAGGGIGLFVNRLITEGGPEPHPIQIRLMPGATHPPLNSEGTQVIIKSAYVADGYVFDSHIVYIDPSLHAGLAVGTVICEDIGGSVFGPCIWTGNDTIETALATTPNKLRQYGYFRDGRLSGNHGGGRAIGAPGTALPSSSGSLGTFQTNLLEDNPTAWGHTVTTYTAPVTDRLGLLNAGRIAPGVGGGIVIPQSSLAPASTTLVVGDYVVFGVWTRGAAGPNQTFLTMSQTTISAANFIGGGLQPAAWLGNADWEFACGYAQVSTGGSGAFQLTVEAGQTESIEACYPVLAVLKASDGYTEEAAAEQAAHLASWNQQLAQGAAGTFRGQPFVASGGLGVGAGVTRTAGVGSGQLTVGAILTYEPRYSDDGKTLIGWVPVYSATVNP